MTSLTKTISILFLLCLTNFSIKSQSKRFDLGPDEKKPAAVGSFKNDNELGVLLINKRKIRALSFEKSNFQLREEYTFESKKINHHDIKGGYLGTIVDADNLYLFYLSESIDSKIAYKNILTLNKSTLEVSHDKQIFPSFSKIFFTQKNRLYLLIKGDKKFAIHEYRSNKLHAAPTFDYDLDFYTNEVSYNNTFRQIKEDYGTKRMYVTDSTIQFLKTSQDQSKLELVTIDLEDYELTVYDKLTPKVPSLNNNVRTTSYLHGQYLMQFTVSKDLGVFRITDLTDQNVVQEIDILPTDEPSKFNSGFTWHNLDVFKIKEITAKQFLKSAVKQDLSIISNIENDTVKVALGSYLNQTSTHLPVGGGSAMNFSSSSSYQKFGLLFDNTMNRLQGAYKFQLADKWDGIKNSAEKNKGHEWATLYKEPNLSYVVRLVIDKSKSVIELTTMDY